VSTIITVRIDKETRRKIKKYKIKVSKVVRAALKSEIRKKEKQELKEKLSDAKSILTKLS
jgi:post-segregation antitoxin (ccd killing protein)